MTRAGTIFGRPVNVTLAALTAVFNVVVLAHVAGFAPTAEVVAAVNGAIAAVVVWVANGATS